MWLYATSFSFTRLQMSSLFAGPQPGHILEGVLNARKSQHPGRMRPGTRP